MSYTTKSGCASIAWSEIHSMGLRGLGAAILLQAADDWRKAKKRGGIIRFDNETTLNSADVIRDVEAFLMGEYCELLCPGMGPRILKRLREGR